MLVHNLVTLDWKVGVVRVLGTKPQPVTLQRGVLSLWAFSLDTERTSQKLKSKGLVLKGQAAKKSRFWAPLQIKVE